MPTALIEPSRAAAAASDPHSELDQQQTDAAVALAKELLAASLADESPASVVDAPDSGDCWPMNTVGNSSCR